MVYNILYIIYNILYIIYIILYIESPLGGTTAAPHLGTLHCIRVCLGVGGVVAIIIAEVLSQFILKSVKRALMVGLVGAFLTSNFIKSLQGGLEGSQGHPGRLLGALGDILGHPERLLGALGDVLGRQGGAPEGVCTTKGGLGKGLGPSQK